MLPKRNVIIHAVHAGGCVEHESGQSSLEAAQHQALPVTPKTSILGHEETMKQAGALKERNKKVEEAARASLAKFLEEKTKSQP